MRHFVSMLAVAALGWAGSATAAEIRIGEDVVKNGMKIGAVYLQAVKMDMGHGGHGSHGGHDMPKKEAMDHGSHGSHAGHGGHQMHHAGSHATTGDFHLEADVVASADNDWGFPEGAWIPYLKIDWVLTKKGSDWSKAGTFLAMAASDGPHYGDNINLDGPGKYTATYTISPPDPSLFVRHFDKETGVAGWWEPFDVSWDFVFTGTGKKGGY